MLPHKKLNSYIAIGVYAALTAYLLTINIACSSTSPSALGYFNSGLAKYKLKDYEGAKKDYDKSIELDPYLTSAYINRAITKRKLNDHAGAKIDCDKAIELDPKFAIAYHNRGISKIYLGDNAGAKVDHEKAIELDPNLADSYYGLCCLYSIDKDATTALSYLRQALQKGFNNFDHIATDSDMNFIRNLPEFKALIEEFKAKRGK